MSITGRYIVGFGAAGISAATHILNEYPNQPLSVIYSQSANAPSNDVSKIVRTGYHSLGRMKEAIEAQREWKHSRYYKKCGRLVAYATSDDTLESITSNRAFLNLESQQVDINPETWGVNQSGADLKFVFNADDGIVDWSPCIEEWTTQVLERCHSSGGTVYEQALHHICFEQNQVTQMVLEDGTALDTTTADIILAVGPWTKELLERSSIVLPTQSRLPIPTGIFAFRIELTPEQHAYYLQSSIYSEIGCAEFLLPTESGSPAKITWVEPFIMSHVQDLSDSDLAHEHLGKVVMWARKRLPQLKGAKITEIRSYCDGVTASQSPLIDQHPTLNNLKLNCGGSYTGAKFMTSRGRYVVDILNGNKVPVEFSWIGSEEMEKDQPRLVANATFEEMNKRAAQSQSKDLWSIPCTI